MSSTSGRRGTDRHSTAYVLSLGLLVACAIGVTALTVGGGAAITVQDAPVDGSGPDLTEPADGPSTDDQLEDLAGDENGDSGDAPDDGEREAEDDADDERGENDDDEDDERGPPDHAEADRGNGDEPDEDDRDEDERDEDDDEDEAEDGDDEDGDDEDFDEDSDEDEDGDDFLAALWEELSSEEEDE